MWEILFLTFQREKWLRILQDGGEDESNVSCSYLSHIWQIASKQSDMKNADNTENRKKRQYEIMPPFHWVDADIRRRRQIESL